MIFEVICECLMLAKDLTFCVVAHIPEVLVRPVKFHVKDRENPTPLHYREGRCKNRSIITILKKYLLRGKGRKI